MAENTIFFSYSPEDSEFVLSLAKSLREAGAKVWLDQLDIKPGNRRDESVESALKSSHTLLVVLSQASVTSDKVMDEVSYALEENKTVVPLLLEECNIPFRIRRLQYATFTEGTKKGVDSLISALQLDDYVANKLAQDATITYKQKQINDFTEQEEIKPLDNSNDNTIKKSNNSLVYLLIGLSIVIILAVLLMAPRNGNSNTENPVVSNNPNAIIEQNEVIQTDTNPEYTTANNNSTNTNSQTQIEKDWAQVSNTNSIEAYIQFVSTYGKNNAYYNDAFTRMKNMFSNSGYVKYGIVNVEQYFDKTLYFNGTELTIPEKGDFISPKMTNEIWNNNNPTGYYVQPGRFYLVLDVATNNNNEVWVHLGI